MSLVMHQSQNNSQETTDASTPDELTGLNGVTWAAWWNFQSLGTNDDVWTRWATGQQSWRMTNNNTGDKIHFYMDSTSNHAVFSGPGALSTNTWYNIVIRFDGSVINQLKLACWVNGVRVEQSTEVTVTGTIPGTIPSSNQGISIGADSSGSAEGRCTVAEATIWNTALSDQEAASLYLQPHTRVRLSNIFVHWPLFTANHRTDLIRNLVLANQQANTPIYDENPNTIPEDFLGA